MPWSWQKVGIFGAAQAPWHEAGFRVILAPRNKALQMGNLQVFCGPSKSVLVNVLVNLKPATLEGHGAEARNVLKIDPQNWRRSSGFKRKLFSAQDMSDWSEQVCSDLRSFRPLASRNCSCSRGSSVDFPASVLFASVSSIFRLQSVG